MPSSSTTRLSLLAGVLLVPAFFVLALWAGQGLEDSLNVERHRIQRFEELAAAHVVNNLGSELYHLYFTIGQQLGRLSEYPTSDRLKAVGRVVDLYRTMAHEPELLSDVLVATEGPQGAIDWKRYSNSGWVSTSRPLWVPTSLGIFNPPSDPTADLESPLGVFPLPPTGGNRQAVIVRYSVDLVVGKIVPDLAQKAFRESGGPFGYEVRVARQWMVPDGELATPSPDLVVPLVPPVRFSDWLRNYLDHTENAPRAVPITASGAARWVLVVKMAPDGLKAYTDSLALRNHLWVAFLSLLLIVGLALLALALRKLTLAARREQSFAALVSHELKTPLAAIKSLSENLADGVVTEASRVREYGAEITEQSGRLVELVSKILAFTAFEVERSKVTRECFDAGALAQEVGDRFGITVDRLPGNWSVRGNRAAIGAALDNLVTNARRYGANPGVLPEVAIVLARRSRWGLRWVGIKVSDNGPGMDKAERRRLFQPYHRGHRDEHRRFSGGGVGLSLVKETMDHLGGRIELRTSPGKGLELTLWLRERGNR